VSVGALTALLERHHGVRVDELTEGLLHQALGEGMAGAGDTLDARARQIAADRVLQQELLDRITLQESSFFRDPLVFADLAAHVLPAAIRALAGRPLVVWSAGCANGQEAWSLAMLLAELGAPRFEVVASDLSETAAARTGAGAYGERELRGLDAARRERFMVRAGARWRVTDSLRRHVRVVHQNVATERPSVADGSCALVLCRYVLIYLTPAAADALLGRIAAALSPDGRLVVGAAESLRHRSERSSRKPCRAPSPTTASEQRTSAGQAGVYPGRRRRRFALTPVHGSRPPRATDRSVGSLARHDDRRRATGQPRTRLPRLTDDLGGARRCLMRMSPRR